MKNLKTTFIIALIISLFTSHDVCCQKKSVFGQPPTFESKLKDNKQTQLIAWTDKSNYKLGDTITLIVETNRILKKFPQYTLDFSQVKRGTTLRSTSIKNHKVYSYYFTKYITKKTGKIIIPKLNIVIDNKQYSTKKIKLKIKL